MTADSPAQRWATFVRNHAPAVLVCDFFLTITARFRLLYVFVVLDVGTRRIVHWNVTEHPTADWTIQQCRALITGETAHRFLIHDRDAIYAPAVDRAITAMGLRVLKTPVRTPHANPFCERVIGTIRRECLDWLIPLHGRHLRGDPARMGDALQPAHGSSPPRAQSCGRDADTPRTAPRISP
jgi:transposase InsO family protein